MEIISWRRPWLSRRAPSTRVQQGSSPKGKSARPQVREINRNISRKSFESCWEWFRTHWGRYVRSFKKYMYLLVTCWWNPSDLLIKGWEFAAQNSSAWTHFLLWKQVNITPDVPESFGFCHSWISCGGTGSRPGWMGLGITQSGGRCCCPCLELDEL